jgi:hypothetical protein
MPRSSQTALVSLVRPAIKTHGGATGKRLPDGSFSSGRAYFESEWTISRRPNIRESSENAPGPKRKRAAVTKNERAN